MVRYVLGRLALAVLVIWAAWSLAYLIVYSLPGDPVSVMLAGAGGDNGYIDPAAADALRADLGLDRPFHERYLGSLTDLFQGDMGTSVATGQSVSSMLAAALPHTLALGFLALLMAVVGAAMLAFSATAIRAVWMRELLLSVPPLTGSAPTFWIGLLLMQFLSFRLQFLPAIGDRGWQSLVLPSLTLAIPIGATIAQVLASSLRTAQGEGFVRTARGTGASRGRALIRHAGRAAAVAPLTVLGLAAANIVAGAVVVETVFARRGVGRLTADAVTSQDLPVVVGVVLVAALAFVVVNLVVDLILPMVDPRMRPAIQVGSDR